VSGQHHAPAALYPRGKDPRYPLCRRLGGPQSRSGHRGYRKNPLPLPGAVLISPQLLASCSAPEKFAIITNCNRLHNSPLHTHQIARQFTCAVLSLQVKRYPVKATHHSSFLSVLLEEFPSVVEKTSSDDDLLTYAAIAITLEKKLIKRNLAQDGRRTGILKESVFRTLT
jgi:hypothetical protein